MSLSSFRLSLLDFAARVLNRWLNAVNARIDAHPVREADPPERLDDRPVAPDHWVEMVRQRAPQLLDPNADDSSGVIDYRANDALVKPSPVFTPPARAPKVHPVSVITPHPRQPVPAVRTAPQRQPRPMRLNNVTTQPLDAEPEQSSRVAEYPAQTAAEALELPATPTTPRDLAELAIRRPAELEADPLPVRPYPGLPVEQHIREIHSGYMDAPDVPSVRTSASRAPHVSQTRTGVPKAPEQTVLRPSVQQKAQTVRENADNLWASLPESAPEEAYNKNAEQNHRARLRREQEGRAWSE